MNMKPLIKTIQAESCPRTWLAAVEYLLSLDKRERYNLTLGVESPEEMTPVDFRIHDLVDDFLRAHDQLPLATVAGTIFPANHYLRNETKGVYEDFPEEFSKLERHSWGTYAMRMLRQEGKNGRPINPLEVLVKKLKNNKKNFRLAYELNVAETDASALEIPIYSAKTDLNLLLQQPCLSHLTFKVYEGDALSLVVLYRSHYYVTKALGNLLGLAQLQSFVANETGLRVGPLICHSTHARIDTAKGMNLAGVKKLISQCKAA
jgi:hypothetical protein